MRHTTFADRLAELELAEMVEVTSHATDVDVDAALSAALAGRADEWHLAALLSPAAGLRLEDLAAAAQRVTLQRFGRTIHLFAPLYLSNHCLSTCTYCGFSKHLDVRRRTLNPGEVEREAKHLLDDGFKHLLLVSAEHQKHVSPEYLEMVCERLSGTVPSMTIETQVWDQDVYNRLDKAGCEGAVIYQETYMRDTYREVHVGGKKRDYDHRLAGPERVAESGMRRIGIGALFGLHTDWREDALSLGAHALWLMRKYWRMEVTVAFPRMRPSASGFQPRSLVDDRLFAQLTAAFRLLLPDAGIVLSTRESPALRDGLLPFGITHMSAGSVTEPGGYEEPGSSEEQFAISDERSPSEVAAMLRSRGYDPVWKDFSPALAGAAREQL